MDAAAASSVVASLPDTSRAGLKTVLLPEKNMKDLVELPKTARSELKIIPIKHMDDVLAIALSKEVTVAPPRPKKQARDEQVEE